MINLLLAEKPPKKPGFKYLVGVFIKAHLPVDVVAIGAAYILKTENRKKVNLISLCHTISLSLNLPTGLSLLLPPPSILLFSPSLSLSLYTHVKLEGGGNRWVDN